MYLQVILNDIIKAFWSGFTNCFCKDFNLAFIKELAFATVPDFLQAKVAFGFLNNVLEWYDSIYNIWYNTLFGPFGTSLEQSTEIWFQKISLISQVESEKDKKYPIY